MIPPAFGVTVQEMQALRDSGLRSRRHDVRLRAQRVCRKNVDRFSSSGIHGDHPRRSTRIEETRCHRVAAAARWPVDDLWCSSWQPEEAEVVCARIAAGRADRAGFLARFAGRLLGGILSPIVTWRCWSVSPARRPCCRSESLAIQGENPPGARRSPRRERELSERFRAFDTICQRDPGVDQDAIVARRDRHPDLILAIGG